MTVKFCRIKSLLLALLLIGCVAAASAEETGNVQTFVDFSPLDELGRVGEARACIGPEYPAGARSSIQSIKPTGWSSVRYDGVVPGGWLFNRCHLIAARFADSDVTENIFTGTHALNYGRMNAIENEIAAYIARTGHHVRMRVIPVFLADELICRAVVILAESVEDEEVRIAEMIMNDQPGIEINYKTGESRLEE